LAAAQRRSETRGGPLAKTTRARDGSRAAAVSEWIVGEMSSGRNKSSLPTVRPADGGRSPMPTPTMHRRGYPERTNHQPQSECRMMTICATLLEHRRTQRIHLGENPFVLCIP
jgi:hypothetical protein